jgi:hypothetical protein
MMARARRTFVGNDGMTWRIDVRNPGSSNALVVFSHPDPSRTRESRYAHYLWTGPESQNVSGRIDPAAVLSSLDDAALAKLFRRSMPIAGRPTIEGKAY